MPNVQLYNFNTIPVTAGTVYRLVTRDPTRLVYFNLLNLGPGTLYYRAVGDPAVNDPQSAVLPALAADNQIPIYDGARGLGVLADQAGMISVRIWNN